MDPPRGRPHYNCAVMVRGQFKKEQEATGEQAGRVIASTSRSTATEGRDDRTVQRRQSQPLFLGSNPLTPPLSPLGRGEGVENSVKIHPKAFCSAASQGNGTPISLAWDSTF